MPNPLALLGNVSTLAKAVIVQVISTTQDILQLIKEAL